MEDVVEIFPKLSIVAIRGDNGRLSAAGEILGTVGELAFHAVPLSCMAELVDNTSLQLFLLYVDDAQYHRLYKNLNTQESLECLAYRLQTLHQHLYEMVYFLGECFAVTSSFFAEQSYSTRDDAYRQRIAAIRQELDVMHCSAYKMKGIIYNGLESIIEALHINAFIGSCELLLLETLQDDPRAMQINEYREKYARTHQILASVAQELGEPAYTKAPIADFRERMVLVSSDNPIIASWKDSRELEIIPYKGKALVPLKPEDISKLQRIDSLVVVFLSASDYDNMKCGIPMIQFERYIDARINEKSPPASLLFEKITAERCALIGLLKTFRQGSMPVEHAKLDQKLDNVLREESEKLRLLAECRAGGNIHYDCILGNRFYGEWIAVLRLLGETAGRLGETDVVEWAADAVHRMNTIIEMLR